MTARDMVIARAQGICSRAWAETAELAASEGAAAIAGRAFEPGGPSREEIASRYAAWQAEERGKQAGSGETSAA